MAAAATTRVEIDSELQDLARVDLGFNALRVAQQRNVLAERDAADLAVRAVGQSRRAAG